jgi:glycosyltransferase involved in cell wall biosynthesis
MLVKPLISIIIITYNQELFIGQCIKSILNQESNYPFEIIVSDDNSTDTTQDIVRLLAAEYPNLIKVNFNLQNLGIVKNYLTALNLCRGKYLCLIGGDDYWIDKCKLQNQVDFLEANPDYGLVYTDFSVQEEKTGKFTECYLKKSGYKPVEGDAARLTFIGQNQIMSLTTCIRLNLLNNDYKKIMNDSNFLAEDYPTCFWISMFSKIHFLSINTAVYRVHKKSYTSSHTNLSRWKFSRSHIYMRKKLMNYFNYKPQNYEEITVKINRMQMLLTLKTGIGRNISTISYNQIVSTEMIQFDDHLIYLGIRYSFLSTIIRGILLVKNKTLKFSKTFLNQFTQYTKTIQDDRNIQ